MNLVYFVLLLTVVSIVDGFWSAKVALLQAERSKCCKNMRQQSTTCLLAANDVIIPIVNEPSKLNNFLTDLESIGPVRFVVVGSGAILETVGSFKNLRYAETPKGKLATISTDSPCFECHIRLAEVKEIKNIVVEKFGKQLRITRFLDGVGGTVLSAILHADPADTYQQRSSTWEGLVAKHGAEFKV